jgi:hypothetical protein
VQFRRIAALAGFIDDLKAALAESPSIVADAEPVQRNDWIVQPAPRPVRETQKIESCDSGVMSSILIVEADRVAHHCVRRGDSPVRGGFGSCANWPRTSPGLDPRSASPDPGTARSNNGYWVMRLCPAARELLPAKKPFGGPFLSPAARRRGARCVNAIQPASPD